jgi:uncharacterized protein YjbJ (UPF0337 family)
MDSYRNKDAYREDKSSVKESVCKLRDNAAIETKGKIEKIIGRVQQQEAWARYLRIWDRGNNAYCRSLARNNESPVIH